MASSGMVNAAPTQGISMIIALGTVYHLMGPLIPNEGMPKFAQLYIIDNDLDQLNQRMSHFSNTGMSRELLHRLQQCLHEDNPFVMQFRQTIQDLQAENVALEEREIIIGTNGHIDHRRYNPPTGEGQQEVAGFIPGSDDGGVDQRRQIRIRARGDPNQLQFMNDANKLYDSMHFVLFHPQGQQGWEGHGIVLVRPTPQINANNINEDENDETPVLIESTNAERPRGRGRQKHHVSESGYAAYFMQDRSGQDNSYFRYGKRLFQEWMEDQFAKTDSQRLLFIQNNQKTLRVDLYKGVRDAMRDGDNNLESLGTRVILPSTHIGGQRFFQLLFQYAMAIVRALGRPDYFITMTCNTNWDKITEVLKPGEVPNDRPDIISRVFWMKLEAVLDDLLKNGVFGRVIGHIHVIEFQKRGLPHAHILIIMCPEDKSRTTEDTIDKVVRAEIPDPITEPRLWQVVTSTMMHGPCGAAKPSAACMRNGCCRFGYPKQFQEETTLSEDYSYPIYRRRNNGRTFQNEQTGVVYDNPHVAPYNPFLSLKYNCHINMEVCSSITVVKYMCQYVYKGDTRAIVSVSADEGTNQVHDEVREYQDGRYIEHLRHHGVYYSFPCIFTKPHHNEYLDPVHHIKHLPSVPVFNC